MIRMSSENEKTDPEYIKVEGADIFFFCDVTNESVTELCQAVRKIEREHLGLGIEQPCVRIHIQSDGGCLYPGLAALDFLKASRAHVTCIAEGMCASAATFIFLGGDRRIVRPNAYVLIHQIGDTFWGTFEQLRDEMRQCKQLMRHIKRIYLAETSLPSEKLDRLMKRDLYLSARKCIKYGLEK